MGAGDVFAVAAMNLHKQNSQMSRGSRGSLIGSRHTSVRKKELTSKQKFKGLALKAIKQENEEHASPIRKSDPIGSTRNSLIRRNRSLRRSLIQRGNSLEEADKLVLSDLNTDQLVTYNPKLASFSPTTRIAYAKFKNVIKKDLFALDEEGEVKSTSVHIESETKSPVTTKAPANGQLKVQLESPKSQNSETLEVQKHVKSASPAKSPVVPPKSPARTPVPSAPLSPAISSSPISPVKPPPTPKKTPKKIPEPPVTPPTPAKSPVKMKPETEENPAKSPVKSPVKSPAKSPLKSPAKSPIKSPEKSPSRPSKIEEKREEVKQELKSPAKSTESKSPGRSPRKHPVVEVKAEEQEEASFDPKGKSVCSGKNITGWL